MDASICSKIIVGKTGSLVDTRDNTIYTIGKLDDNKCWLLDNLSLNLTNQSVLNNLDSTNTNASSESLEYLRGERIRNPVADPNGKYATAGVTNWTSGYSHSAPLVNMSNVNTVPTDTISTANGWKIGGYYNYCAANAGSYCYGNGTSSVAISGINSTEDICPSGWRLGSTGVNGDYQVLANIISGTTGDITTNEAYTAYRNALRLPLSGYRNTDGTNVGVSSYGYFWTLDSHSSGVGAIYRILAHPSTTISLGSAANAFYGFSVRCVAK